MLFILETQTSIPAAPRRGPAQFLGPKRRSRTCLETNVVPGRRTEIQDGTYGTERMDMQPITTCISKFSNTMMIMISSGPAGYDHQTFGIVEICWNIHMGMGINGYQSLENFEWISMEIMDISGLIRCKCTRDNPHEPMILSAKYSYCLPHMSLKNQIRERLDSLIWTHSTSTIGLTSSPNFHGLKSNFWRMFNCHGWLTKGNIM